MKSAIYNLVVFNMIYKLPIKPSLAKSNISFNSSKNTSGFTLIEVLVVIVMVGILSAIAAPSWLGFVARQRLNKANDTVLAALREAQREAKKNKRSYSVSFRKNKDNANVIEYAVYPTKNLDGEQIESNTISIWKPIGGELGINSEKFLVGTNLKGINEGNSDNNNDNNIKTIESTHSTENVTETIAFDYAGTLPRDAIGMPFKIVLATPKDATSDKPSNLKRCVIVETFIGGIRTGKDGECDNRKNSTW